VSYGATEAGAGLAMGLRGLLAARLVSPVLAPWRERWRRERRGTPEGLRVAVTHRGRANHARTRSASGSDFAAS
jgi:hypothetical protein